MKRQIRVFTLTQIEELFSSKIIEEYIEKVVDAIRRIKTQLLQNVEFNVEHLLSLLFQDKLLSSILDSYNHKKNSPSEEIKPIDSDSESESLSNEGKEKESSYNHDSSSEDSNSVSKTDGESSDSSDSENDKSQHNRSLTKNHIVKKRMNEEHDSAEEV